MVNWRQNQPQMQAATETVAVVPSAPVEVPARKQPRAKMMRQYDLLKGFALTTRIRTKIFSTGPMSTP